MVWCLWGSKGGSGCSVVAASAALLSARRGPVLLVDLAGGDQARILGVEPGGAGLARWLRHPNPPPDSLGRLEMAVSERVALLPHHGAGGRSGGQREADGSLGPRFDVGERINLLAHLLAADDRRVIVDLGLAESHHRETVSSPLSISASAFPAVVAVAERSTLVTRLCYLAIAAAMDLPVPDDVVVVAEPDRALRATDVEAALRVPVNTVRCDPAVARAVDSGLLTRRLPRSLHRIPLTVSSSVEARRSAAAARTVERP